MVDAPQGVYTSLEIAPRAAATVLVANWESAINPLEIVRIDPTTKKRDFLTSFNTAKAASIDWLPLRDFWFTGRDGRRIHSFVALPPQFDETKKYPLLVLMHGGFASSWRDSISYRWNYHLLAHPGFVLLATDYRGSTGYGEKFALIFSAKSERRPTTSAMPPTTRSNGFRSSMARRRSRGQLRRAHGQLDGGTTTRYKAIISHAGLATLDMQWGRRGIFHRELMMGGPCWENPQKWIEQSPL